MHLIDNCENTPPVEWDWALHTLSSILDQSTQFNDIMYDDMSRLLRESDDVCNKLDQSEYPPSEENVWLYTEVRRLMDTLITGLHQLSDLKQMNRSLMAEIPSMQQIPDVQSPDARVFVNKIEEYQRNMCNLYQSITAIQHEIANLLPGTPDGYSIDQ